MNQRFQAASSEINLGSEFIVMFFPLAYDAVRAAVGLFTNAAVGRNLPTDELFLADDGAIPPMKEAEGEDRDEDGRCERPGEKDVTRGHFLPPL